MQQLLECVPNFSIGNDPIKIEKIAQSIRNIKGVQILNIDANISANRTVITFVGTPEAVVEAAFQAISCASIEIDMRQQIGAHPRVGATDVCPLIPIQNINDSEAIKWSKILAQRVGTELRIPVFLYEQSAKFKHRSTLPAIRKGQYEKMEEKIKHIDWSPDYGGTIWNPKTGATIIGVRKILVAFNISLNTKDIKIAQKIAGLMRTNGFELNNEKSPYSLPKLRAIGWYLEDYNHTQVSFNLLDYKTTPLVSVFETCQKIALENGVNILGSELIGLMPLLCLEQAAEKSGNKNDLKSGIQYLLLNNLKPFEVENRILELILKGNGFQFEKLN